MNTLKNVLIFVITLSATACLKRSPTNPWHNPKAIGPDSVLINRPDGTAFILNPDNHEMEEEPNRDVGLAKLPPMDMGREANPRDPQISDLLPPQTK